MFQNKISIEQYQGILNQPHVIIDCRFQLSDTEAGRRAYQQSHIPNALYAHLDEDCSGKITPQSSRHPLPEVSVFLGKVASWGINRDTQVVVYDDKTGGIAARLWWMLKKIGVENTAILEGGFTGWQNAGLPVNHSKPAVKPVAIWSSIESWPVISTQDMMSMINDPTYLIIDARAAVRYAGLEEPIDPIAGHIPNALNRFHGENFDENGLLKPNSMLHAEYTKLLGNYKPENIIFYCGSGVTSCTNVFAMEVIGMPGANLYAGSWSEWIRDPQRPIITK